MLFFWNNDYHVFFFNISDEASRFIPSSKRVHALTRSYLFDCDLVITTLLVTNSSDRTAKSSSCPLESVSHSSTYTLAADPSVKFLTLTSFTLLCRPRKWESARISVSVVCLDFSAWKCIFVVLGLSVCYWGKSSCSFLFRNNGLTF